MTKFGILERLKRLNYSHSEYWVVAGSAMVLHGLREATSDVDLGCTKALADILESSGCKTAVLDDGTRKILVAEDVEIFENWLFDEVVIIEGIPVISLKGLLEMKKQLGRAKDIEDIKVIEAALSKI
ncbi:MAG: hypothetical protein IKL27_03390 [Oscillospiraceae bacterium]|nr:hypothetical protein [Oscillospiraceae bacterium]